MAPQRSARAWSALCVLASALASGSGAADGAAGGAAGATATRSYEMLRDAENWSFLRRTAPTDFWDRVKYVRFVEGNDEWYATFGGEVREWLEYYRDYQWGLTPYEDNGYLLQRYMVHADMHLSRFVRVFVQPKSGLEVGRLGGPRPTDKDELDLQSAFIDVNLIASDDPEREPTLVLRTGRQEMQFGNARLVSAREGPNVRQTFDGVRLISRPGYWRFDVFATRPVTTDPGVFDDKPDPSQAFFGINTSGPLPISGVRLDVYSFVLDRDNAKYDKGVGHERRGTTGALARARFGDLSMETEGLYQYGAFANGPISAWSIASAIGEAFPSLPLRPTLNVGGGITSGTQNRSGRTLGTFNPLFPRGAYFGNMSANGALNQMGEHHELVLHPSAALALSIEQWFFWRESVQDGVYGIPGNLLRPSGRSSAQYIGSQVEIDLGWQVDPHLSMHLNAAKFWAGAFLQQTPPGRDTTHLATWVTYKF